MQNNSNLLLLKICVFLIFIGRAWQHLFWDAPYRTFFWDESTLQGVVESVFNIPWEEYATSIRTDTLIQNCIKTNGVLYLVAGLSAILLTKTRLHWLRIPIIIGGCSLVMLTILMTKEKFYHTAQFFEHSIQFSLPFMLLYCYTTKFVVRKFIFIAKIVIAFTFFSHGLYAFGFYPVPGKFIDMVIQILGCTEKNAISFLYVAGILDFILAVLIFVPKLQWYALWYAVIWGVATALARIVANFYLDFPLLSIHQHFYEVLYRLPHGLTPLLVIRLLKTNAFDTFYKKKRTVFS